MIAEVIIDIKHHDVNQLYDYFIPEHLTDILEIGMRVWVPFSHQSRTGIVLNLKESSTDATKDILEIDSGLPVLSQYELNGIHELVKQNHMLYQQAVELMIPHLFHVKYHYEIKVHKKDDLLETLEMYDVGQTYNLLKKDEIHLSKLKLRHHKGILELSQITKTTQPKRKIYQYIYSGLPYKRLHLKLMALKIHEPYKKDVLIEIGFSDSNIKTLVKHGILIQQENTIIKLQQSHPIGESKYPSVLIHPYESMLDDLKTKIEYAITHKENMLILVPNIQRLTQLKEYFMLSLRYDYKSSAKTMLTIIDAFQDHSQILISTRKGIFLPVSFDHIFIVESHSITYRYDQGVFFDAIETIEKRFPHASVCLHTYEMTPRLQHMNLKNIHQSFQPHDMNAQLHVVSMKEELLAGHTKVLSRNVIESVKEALKTKHVVMYYPKKGYLTVNVCRLCGDVQTCPRCNQKLKVTSSYEATCSTCHDTYPLIDTCQYHHQKMMKPLGLGLEYVAKHIQTMFKDHPVHVIDKEHTHVEFSDKQSILIGTQKLQSYLPTLDFEMAVIVLADLSFHVMDMLDDERHFFDLLMLTPLVHQKIKKTWIQTYDPEHIMIKGLFDTKLYMNERLKERELLSLPPYTKLFEIVHEHASFFKGYQEILKIKASLNDLNIQVVGPLYEDIQPFKLLVKIFQQQSDDFYQFITKNRLRSRRIQ